MIKHLRQRWVWFGSVLLVALVLASIGAERGAPGSLLPHGYCFTWNPTLLWTHVISDALIGTAYVSIPVTLLYLISRRGDVPFDWMILLFAVFIVSCGATHWIEVWTVWNPDYWLSGSVKVVTAASSVLTAAALVGMVPRILAIPTTEALTAAKQALEAEVERRREAEAALLHERAELESRVLERTRELDDAKQAAELAHARAEEANRLKDRFLAKVSHELRTPLQSTLTWSQLLQKTPFDPAKATQASERIVQNVRSQARLIDDLLDISRILSGKLKLERQRVDAATVIEKGVEVVRSAAEARDIRLELERDGADAVVDMDPVRLEQVVWNLVSNAVQASAGGARVRVRFGAQGAMFRFEVRDWGHGIAAFDLEHIFEPFRQGPGGAGAHRGLGLGLAIARSIAEQSGGRLTAASDGPGQGARFTLLLPIPSTPPADEDAPKGSTLTPEEATGLAGLRVLYVEDEPDIAEGGAIMLSSMGVNVDLCLTFERALHRLQAGGFDLLLSDFNLGGGHTAFELIARLRALPQGRDIPAVLLSAYGSVDDLKRSREAGFFAHLVKPAEAAEVARCLVAAMARPPERR